MAERWRTSSIECGRYAVNCKLSFDDPISLLFQNSSRSPKSLIFYGLVDIAVYLQEYHHVKLMEIRKKKETLTLMPYVDSS